MVTTPHLPTTRSWALLLISCLGSLVLHGLVINQAIMSKVPNMLTGLVPLDLLVDKPPVEVSQELAGGSYQVETPETHVGIVAKQPVAFEMTMDRYTDMVVAMVLPLVLAMLTLPFTLLRLLLLGWDCNLVRNQVGTILHEAPQEWPEDGEARKGPGQGRSILTLFCGIAGMVSFTKIVILVVFIYVIIIIQSYVKPLVKDAE